ncbi:hypothetical protein [Salsipaludibacter albus]|uniref:hypothetical protein n=1 Tax=Salsipaludibacter albus TaxID=2849650 RepID=UPI001EE44575|nr:hypothetical protein [Salsipaludibacter albus]MBY5162820.1 hypothetical protein [Salsipaludibacter albus]
MIPLLAVIGVGVVALWPRLRTSFASTPPDQAWDHFLVASGLRPVPVSMADVQAVAERAGVPTELLDRAALGRVDGDLALAAPLTNGRVLVGVRRDGPVARERGLVVRDGWQLHLLEGPVDAAWSRTPLTNAGRATRR